MLSAFDTKRGTEFLDKVPMNLKKIEKHLEAISTSLERIAAENEKELFRKRESPVSSQHEKHRITATTTQHNIRAMLSLMVDLSSAAKQIGNEIADMIAPNADDDLYDMLNEIQDCELTNLDEIMEIIKKNGYFTNGKIESGEELSVPYLKFTSLYDIECGVTYSDGSKLAGYIGDADYDTHQVGGIFYSSNGSPIDLVMAEIKKGELAVVSGLEDTNKDIDLYLWGDEATENYTQTARLKRISIDGVLNEVPAKRDENVHEWYNEFLKSGNSIEDEIRNITETLSNPRLNSSPIKESLELYLTLLTNKTMARKDNNAL